MKIKLGKLWELTDERSASSYGMPVLVDTGTREAYGPEDVVNIDGDFLPAVRVVDRFLAISKELSAEEVVFIRKFFLQ